MRKRVHRGWARCLCGARSRNDFAPRETLRARLSPRAELTRSRSYRNAPLPLSWIESWTKNEWREFTLSDSSYCSSRSPSNKETNERSATKEKRRSSWEMSTDAHVEKSWNKRHGKKPVHRNYIYKYSLQSGKILNINYKNSLIISFIVTIANLYMISVVRLLQLYNCNGFPSSKVRALLSRRARELSDRKKPLTIKKNWV